ncbi:MAG: Shikimate 5-dehydrogenase [Rickettsiales bacterium]|jgi:shikimate dehydrogenase|nr:Shikimate 5-dehydrogenase [Rickettsiales bacterium]
MITGNALIAGVIGYPVRHSLSPRLHNYWLEYYKLSGAYIPLEIAPEYLASFIRTLPLIGNWRGLNVTVPHKEAVLGLMDEVDPVAKRIGAVNTVIIREGKLFGTNTDAYGFIANLKEQAPHFSFHGKTALVLGAGGAARAVCAGLQDAGIKEIILANRTIARAEEVANALGGNIRVHTWEQVQKILPDIGLLVNTTTLGMEGKPALNFSLVSLPREALVSDIVYVPRVTSLLETAKAQGNPIVTGLGMLFHQAVPGFEAWFGVRPEVDPALEVLIR